MYKCLFNHELLIAGTSQTPRQRYEDGICEAQLRGFMEELADTDVDAVMLCPTAWRRNLWPSEVDPHWRDEAPFRKAPAPGAPMRYPEKAYYRWREYMLRGGDPVAITCDAVRGIGRGLFISYRMNDHHHFLFPDCPTHNTPYLRTRDSWFLPGRDSVPDTMTGYQDYSCGAVRQYYHDILQELWTRYAPDGIELDFMRSPHYFPDPRKGVGIMTGFVRQIREMTRGGLLCVRVPKTPEEALAAGLDVAAWAREGLVDMINVSSFYINDLRLDIEGYRRIAGAAKVFGEMHFIVETGEIDGFTTDVTRKTNREQYRAMAHTYLSGGADGVSLFNFDYARDHHFGEPRRKGDFGCEPPFDVLRGITDAQKLSGQSRHYYYRAGQFERSDTWEAELRVRLFPCRRSVLRVTLRDASRLPHVRALLDGAPLPEIMYPGELFAPLTTEALPAHAQTWFFELPADLSGTYRLKLLQSGNKPSPWVSAEYSVCL